MTEYVVGDIQGCYESLEKLLKKVAFNPTTDKLWCVGDLVNRGPNSLRTLQFLYSVRHSVITVLGNHDLHLLACYYGHAKLKKNDTITEILDASDAEILINWLRQQPLVYHNSLYGVTMVHAGIPPSWSLEESLTRSAEVEAALKDDKKIHEFLSHMYGSDPVKWDESITGYERLKVITNYLTRMRFCKPDGTIEFKAKEGLDNAPIGYIPWFKIPNRKMQAQDIFFGHWAALEGKTNVPHVYALDTGCVWGNDLTLMDIKIRQKYTTQCQSCKKK